MELASIEPGCLPRWCPGAHQAGALLGGWAQAQGWALPTLPGGEGCQDSPAPSLFLSPSARGTWVVFRVDRDPGAGFRKGWERCPSPTLAQGPGPAWKNPTSFHPRAGFPWEWAWVGSDCPGRSPRESTCWGHTPPKQEVGWGHCRPHPMTSPCFWQSCFPTPNFRPRPWGSGTHLIAPDCPGMLPALSPGSLLGQPTGPAWKNPIGLPALAVEPLPVWLRW